MPDPSPTLYLLHGEDEFAIAQTLAELESKLGDPANASLNTTRLSGDSIQPEQILSIAAAMPFLASRRLVIVTGMLNRLTRAAPQEMVAEPVVETSAEAVQIPSHMPVDKAAATVQSDADGKAKKAKLTPAQEKFLDVLGKIPPTTTLILIEALPPHLTKKEREKYDPKWFKKEIARRSISIQIESLDLPKGVDWIRRLQVIARKSGGQISPAAASMLYSLLDGDVRLADQEIQKLLAYVNYQRRIEPEDIQAVTEDVGQGNIFKLVEALGDRNGRNAMNMLGRLLEYQDDLSIYGMIVRQFRLLILARQIQDAGGSREQIAKKLKINDYVVDRLIDQLRRFTQSDLDRIYHQLLDLDEQAKTSQIPRDLALETFVSALALR